MSNARTIRVLNRSHTNLTLTEPMPNPEKPGDAPPLRSVSLPGNGAVSHVDADTYNAWKAGNEHHTFLTNSILEEVGDDYEAPEEVFGHEPALEALAKNPDAVKAAEAGVVTEAEAGGLTAREMTPENGTPPGDDAGEPRHASQPGEPEPGTAHIGSATGADTARVTPAPIPGPKPGEPVQIHE